MRRPVLSVIFVIICAAGLRALPPASVEPTGSSAFAAATDAWERGDYIAALRGYIGILDGPGADAFVEPIARQTGELFETRELTPDGRAPRFSPDGRYLVYETGLEVSRQTRILRNDAARSLVAELHGVSAAFSPDSTKVAYLRIPENEDLARAAKAIEEAALTARNRGFLTQTLAWLIARDSTIVVHDIASGRETARAAPNLLKMGLSYAADGRTVYFLGGREADAALTDIYAVSEEAPQPVVVSDADGLKSPPLVDPAGAALVYVIPAQNPLKRPTAPQPPGAPSAGGRSGARSRQPVAFAIVDLASRHVAVISGTAPTLSEDGRTIAYIAKTGEEYGLMAGPPLGAQAAIVKGAARLDAPALSADGARVAYQRMDRDDWDIYVASRDGTGAQRVTRDIQHDVLPRFVGSTHILAVMGEPRHRRASLYDLGSAGIADGIRLFHNNSVRTIAPEYQWSTSPDGRQLLVGAERDGNTVSPERGVYLVDLRQKVTKAEVLDRLHASLESETKLKASGTRAFQTIAADVRRVVAQASVARVFGYEKALFDFDSKHITKPGNRKASTFLFDTYQSFGYAPEYQWLDPRGGETANVIATLRGTVDPDLVYVVSSHYDSVAAGPGADDDSSGTAALLEAARVMAGHPMPATIVFASFTGEEAGLLGSREFVRRAVEAKMKIIGALNNDMIGWANNDRLDNTIRYSNPGIRDIQHAAAMLFTRLITYDARYFKGTDAASYYDAYGDIVGGIGSYPVLGSPHYHQPSDLLEYENHQQITETSKATVATLMLLASSPSRLTQLKVDSVSAGTAAVSWAPSVESGVVSYIVSYGPPSNPLQHRLIVTAPHATVAQAAAGTIVSVKAVNAKGMEGWDWATVAVPRASSPGTDATAAASLARTTSRPRRPS